jgi:uncharacterized protein
MDEILTPRLIQTILSDYALPWFGVHGVSHWARVLENGLRLAEVTGANPRVVQCFAVFHDSRRRNEHIDPGHGLRGGDFAKTLLGIEYELTESEFQLLYLACRDHTDGHTDGEITVQTCWDADRLDIGRVGFTVSRRYLSTEAAKTDEIMAWAYERSVEQSVPERVMQDWGIPH